VVTLLLIQAATPDLSNRWTQRKDAPWTPESTLPPATHELVKLRASQIDGRAYCADMHTKEAAHAGESQLRLNLVATWREATVFSEADRAALELAERGTRIADASAGVSDAAWAAVSRYDDGE
jgi:AhpD family alkylhydroperoxidase